MMRRFFVAAAFCALLPAAAGAQSLFSTRGLGVPVDGYDARARSLGVNGVGLLGLTTSMINPAEPAGLVRRGITASFQPWSGTVEFNGEQDKLGGTRFPVIGILYPLFRSRVAVSLGYSGRLDQSWGVAVEGKEVLGADTVSTIDYTTSAGGIGELKLGAAYLLSPSLAVGASVGLHTGGVDRSITRFFPDTTLSLGSFATRQRWDYSGPIATVGFRWDPRREFRLAASLTWSGTLDADPKEGSTAAFSYDMPVRFAAGASGQIAPRLLFAVSGSVSSWGSGSYAAPGTDASTVADRGVEFGGGVEWQELRSGDRIFPLRAGFRMATLPFHDPGDSAPKEWAVSGGLGLRLVEDDFGPLAIADIGFERGKRDGWKGTTAADGLSESFWRFTASISLFGR